MIQDYNKQPLKIGDAIKSIESGWHGQIMSTEGEAPDLMLVCRGINWFTGELDEDDTQWFDPYDVVKWCRNPEAEKEIDQAVNQINFMG